MSATTTPKTGYHCFECKKVVASSTGLKKHTNTPHKKKQCQSTDHEHIWIDHEFQSTEEGRKWIQTQELDKIFRISTSRNGNVEYQCRYITDEQRREAKEKMQNTHKAPASECSAKLTLVKFLVCKCANIESNVCSNSSSVFKLHGCIQHSHEIKSEHLRISSKTKAELVELLQAGVPKNTIIRQYCTNRPGDKIITHMDLRNLERKYVNKDLLMYPKDLRDRRQRAIEIVTNLKDALERNTSTEDMRAMVELVERFHIQTPDEIRKSVCPNIKKKKIACEPTLSAPSQESIMFLDSSSE